MPVREGEVGYRWTWDSYLMNGPWNETSREYYKTVSTIAEIATHEECKRGIEQDWGTTQARHIRFHAKLIGCAGRLHPFAGSKP